MYFIIRNRFWTALRQNMVHFWHRSGKKKEQVIAAKIDTSRYEKLKDRRQNEYEKAAKKAQELFIEEFASRTARYSQNREVI